MAFTVGLADVWRNGRTVVHSSTIAITYLLTSLISDVLSIYWASRLTV